MTIQRMPKEGGQSTDRPYRMQAGRYICPFCGGYYRPAGFWRHLKTHEGTPKDPVVPMTVDELIKIAKEKAPVKTNPRSVAAEAIRQWRSATSTIADKRVIDMKTLVRALEQIL